MNRYLAAMIAAAIAIQLCFASSVEAGIVKDVFRAYTVVNVVKGAKRAKRVYEYVKPVRENSQQIRAAATNIRKYIRAIEQESDGKMSVKQFRDLNQWVKKADPGAKHEARQAFERSKDTIIKKWSLDYGQKFGKYKENVMSPANPTKVWKYKDTRLDAHHIIPLEYGGPNQAFNMFPVRQPGHGLLHGK